MRNKRMFARGMNGNSPRGQKKFAGYQKHVQAVKEQQEWERKLTPSQKKALLRTPQGLSLPTSKPTKLQASILKTLSP